MFLAKARSECVVIRDNEQSVHSLTVHCRDSERRRCGIFNGKEVKLIKSEEYTHKTNSVQQDPHLVGADCPPPLYIAV